MSEESEGIEDLILRLEGIAKKMDSDGWFGDAIDVRDAISRLRKTVVVQDEPQDVQIFPHWVVSGTPDPSYSHWCIKRLNDIHCMYYYEGGAAEEYEWDRTDQSRLDNGFYVLTTEAEAMSGVIEPADVVTVVFHKYVVWQNGGLKNWVIKEKGWEESQNDWHNVRDLGVFETVEVQE